tara:strand:+ start:908 stop:1198 length:291 start_codon:yes stop_codon:yes gene_type:complete
MSPKGRNGNIKTLETMKKEMKLLIDRFDVAEIHNLDDLFDFAETDREVKYFLFRRFFDEDACDEYINDEEQSIEMFYCDGFILITYELKTFRIIKA